MASYTKRDLEEFYDAYAVTMLWAETDESDEQGGQPLDLNYDVDDIADSAEDKMVADCKKFLDRAWPILERAPERIENRPKMELAGHDFWLTRQGHGTGFWEHGRWPKDIGDKLTKLSERFGEKHPYVGDDRRIYLD